MEKWTMKLIHCLKLKKQWNYFFVWKKYNENFSLYLLLTVNHFHCKWQIKNLVTLVCFEEWSDVSQGERYVSCSSHSSSCDFLILLCQSKRIVSFLFFSRFLISLFWVFDGRLFPMAWSLATDMRHQRYNM